MTLTQPTKPEEYIDIDIDIDVETDEGETPIPTINTARSNELKKDIRLREIINNSAQGISKACTDFKVLKPGYTYLQKKLADNSELTICETSFRDDFKDLFETIEQDLQETTGEKNISKYMTKIYQKTIELIFSEILKEKGQKLAKLLQSKSENTTKSELDNILNTELDLVTKILKFAHAQLYFQSGDLNQANLQIETFINQYFSEKQANDFITNFRASIFRPKRRKQNVVIKVPSPKPSEGFITRVPSTSEDNKPNTSNKRPYIVAGTATAVSIAIIALLSNIMTNNSNDTIPKAPPTKTSKASTPTPSPQEIRATVDKASTEINQAIIYSKLSTEDHTDDWEIASLTEDGTGIINKEEIKEAKIPTHFTLTNKGFWRSFQEEVGITGRDFQILLRTKRHLGNRPGNTGYTSMVNTFTITNDQAIDQLPVGTKVKIPEYVRMDLHDLIDNNLELVNGLSRQEIDRDLDSKKISKAIDLNEAEKITTDWELTPQPNFTDKLEQKANQQLNSVDTAWEEIDAGWNLDAEDLNIEELIKETPTPSIIDTEEANNIIEDWELNPQPKFESKTPEPPQNFLTRTNKKVVNWFKSFFA